MRTHAADVQLTKVSVRAQGKAGGSQESARAQLVSGGIRDCDFSVLTHSGVRDRMVRRSHRYRQPFRSPWMCQYLSTYTEGLAWEGEGWPRMHCTEQPAVESAVKRSHGA